MSAFAATDHDVTPASRSRSTTVTVAVLRIVGAGLLATNAGIHAYLWDAGYRSIPTIGTLFLLDVMGASVLSLAVLAGLVVENLRRARTSATIPWW